MFRALRVPLLYQLIAVLSFVQAVYGITSIPNATWSEPSFDYCAALPDPEACLRIQTEARLPNQSPLSKGTPSVMYMHLHTKSIITNADANSTAIFYPRVDDYSELVIPDSWGKLVDDLSDATFPTISMTLLSKDKIWVLPDLQWAIRFNGIIHYVPFRTALAVLDNGNVVDFKWMPTTCTLSTCPCIDNICAVVCPNTDCNLKVYVAWTGTDSSGAMMDSVSRDIWRLQNAL
ncbi:hypothetical protein HDU85_003036 [Gaertneriomyces sp. JEL0708]|nr:hypothetical protein HDU85_003036 [Gaertneriomyces sp. JEL0708]